MNARTAVSSLPLPPYVIFTAQDATAENNGLLQDRVRVLVRTADGTALAQPLAEMDGSLARGGLQVIRDGRFNGVTPIYRLGDFPLADFGLRDVAQTRPGVFDAPGTPEPAPSAERLATIGRVIAYNPPYRIEKLEDDTLDGRPVFHLRLTPLRDAGHHVLRQMWLDKSSFLPLRYQVERYVGWEIIPFRYLVVVNTEIVQGHLVNVDADGHFNVNRILIVHLSGEGRWSISDLSFPATVPAWAFDPDAFREHTSESVPGF